MVGFVSLPPFARLSSCRSSRRLSLSLYCLFVFLRVIEGPLSGKSVSQSFHCFLGERQVKLTQKTIEGKKQNRKFHAKIKEIQKSRKIRISMRFDLCEATSLRL